MGVNSRDHPASILAVGPDNEAIQDRASADYDFPVSQPEKWYRMVGIPQERVETKTITGVIASVRWLLSDKPTLRPSEESRYIGDVFR
jgi:hypothetical protein